MSRETIAEKLARLASAEPEAPSGPLHVTFRLGGRTWAVLARYVRVIARLEAYTPLPGTPPHVLGVIQHRGRILPLFDLRPLYGLPTGGLTDLSRVVVMSDDRGADLGLVADAALDVAPLDSPGDTVVLDGAALLQDPRLFVNGGLPPSFAED
jgi:purine-binding chemotaxis protein CheW